MDKLTKEMLSIYCNAPSDESRGFKKTGWLLPLTMIASVLAPVWAPYVQELVARKFGDPEQNRELARLDRMSKRYELVANQLTHLSPHQQNLARALALSGINPLEGLGPEAMKSPMQVAIGRLNELGQLATLVKQHTQDPLDYLERVLKWVG